VAHSSITGDTVFDIQRNPMSLTDATKLIRHDPKDKKHKRAVGSLKKKLQAHKKQLQARLKDVDAALKRLGR
jgi:hypothetical protein